jgi:TonB family protein
VHLLLALILMVGPGFTASKAKPTDLPILDFVPGKTVDDLITGGGERSAKPPPSAPVIQPPAAQPQPLQPPPEKRREPDPPKDSAPPKPDPDALVSPERKLPDVSTKLITRNADNSEAKAKAEAKARADAKAARDAQQKLAHAFGQAAQRLGDELSGTTSIKLYGPGGGGVPYANFLQSVKSIYENAWVVPDGILDDRATTVASVTIARDGTVVKSRITSRSGNPAVDQSVQATLDRITHAVPLPDTAKEDQRTVTINFNVRAKQGLG